MNYSTAVVLSTFSSVIVFFILFLMYRKDLKKYFKDFWKNKENYMDIGIRCWIIGLLIMFVSNFILNFLLKAGGAANEKAVQTMQYQSYQDKNVLTITKTSNITVIYNICIWN